MARPNPGDDSNPRSGEGGPRHTPAQLATDPAFTGTYGQSAPVSLTRDALAFGFTFATITSTDAGTGLPTAGTITWPDGTTGAFSGATISGTAGLYTGYTVTYAPAGGTTKTVTVSGTQFDTNGNPYGTSAAVA